MTAHAVLNDPNAGTPQTSDNLARFVTPRTDPIDSLRAEIDGYLSMMTRLKEFAHTEILEFLSATLARAYEIRTYIYRDESRKANAFRTRELDPLITQVDLQFKIWSRLITLKQLDWDISRGQT